MNSKSQVFLYEKISLFGLGPVRFWVIWGLLFSLAGYFFIRLDSLPNYWVVWVFFGTAGAFWPVCAIWIYRQFFVVIEFQAKLFWKNEKEYVKWLEGQRVKIFTLNTFWSKAFPIFVSIVGSLTLFYLFFEYSSVDDKLVYLTVFGFIQIAFIGGHGAYIMLALMGLLIELSNRPVNVPFYRLPNPAINKLQSYYSIVAILVTGVYIHILIAIWFSPFGFAPSLSIWLTILGFYPLGMFLVSIYFTHKIIQNIKQAHLEIINKEVQEALRKVTKNKTASGYEALKGVMDVQAKVQTMSEWPVEFSGTLTLIVTLGTAVGQLIISLLKPP